MTVVPLMLTLLAQPASADAPSVVLANDSVLLAFERPYMGLTTMVDLSAELDHMSAAESPRPLWILTFKAGPGADETVTLASTDAPCTSARTDGKTNATFRWDGLSIEGEPAAVDVKVRVDLPPDSGIAEWRIWVDNSSETYGLWEIRLIEIAE